MELANPYPKAHRPSRLVSSRKTSPHCDSESWLEKQFSVDELTVGMFVSALDRPWLDTPFLLQGFLIEDEQTLAQLRQSCSRVTVDLRRSAVNDAGCPDPSSANFRRPSKPRLPELLSRPPNSA